MSYSVDHAYLEYYRCAANGKYENGFFNDRLTLLLLAIQAFLTTSFRIILRSINLPILLVKISFYLFLLFFYLPIGPNRRRTVANFKLLVLNLAALALQPVQLTANVLSILVGTIHPKVAFQMMHDVSAPIAWITSEERRIRHDYKAPIILQKLTDFFKSIVTDNFENCSWAVKIAMKTVINEFSHAMDSGVVAPLAWMEKFHLFNANPIVLTADQRKLVPILLLNGNYSHQGTFLPLLHALKKSGNKRPVYTVNLPPNCRDNRYIIEKVELIKKQYDQADNSNFSIDMIGHSMGSNCIQFVLQSEPDFEVNRVITLGTPFWIKQISEDKKVFDITAKNDLIIPDKSNLIDGKIEVDTGHLGLLFHKTSLDAMLNFLAK